MTLPPSPPPPRPASHRASAPVGESARRLLPPLAAVAAVVVVIVLLLVLNERPSPPAGAGPALTAPTGSTGLTSTPTPTPARTTAAPAPSRTATVAPPPQTEPPATTGPAVAKVPVTVLNNSRRAHLAEQVAGEVHARGWPIARVGNYRGRVAETTVYYAAGQLAPARELAREFPQIRRVLPRFAGLPGQGLTLVVTRDWS